MKEKVSFEQALEAVGTEQEKLFFADAEKVNLLELDELAYKKLKVLARYYNTDESGVCWSPDFTNSDQVKYYPWARVCKEQGRSSGLGFSNTDYGCDYTGTTVGSRLCFSTSEKAMSFFDYHKDLYLDFWF